MELAKSYREGRRWICRLPFEADLLQAVEDFAHQQEVQMGRFEVLGAVKKSVVGFYHQDRREYQALEFNEPLEILSCFGNLSMREGRVRAHAHIVLGDKEGRALGGHLMPGTVVFAGEAVIQELEGPALRRKYDPRTGLPLWDKH